MFFRKLCIDRIIGDDYLNYCSSMLPCLMPGADRMPKTTSSCKCAMVWLVPQVHLSHLISIDLCLEYMDEILDINVFIVLRRLP